MSQNWLSMAQRPFKWAKGNRLYNVGLKCHKKYRTTRDLADLEMAIQRYQWAVDLTPDDDSHRALRLHRFGQVYHEKWRELKVEADLEITIQLYQEAVNITPMSHPSRASRLHHLGLGFQHRYTVTGKISDLNLAVQSFQEASDTIPENHPGRAGLLGRLGRSYGDRYRKMGESLTDLEMAIQKLQEALCLTPRGSPDRADRLEDLALYYRSRHQRTGAITDLEAALQHFQEAVNITQNSIDRAGRLHNIGLVYGDRYVRTGELDDLEMAMQRFQQAIEKIPNHPDRPNQIRSLGTTYQLRYRRTGAMADLQTAIRLFQDALDIMPANHPERASQLHSLGVGHGYRYLRTGLTTDLEIAVRMLQEATDLTGDDILDRRDHLEALGNIYGFRFRRTGAMADLDTSIQLHEEAANITSGSSLDRASPLVSLAIGYLDKYQRAGAISDLEVAILHLQEAVDITPHNHSRWSVRVQDLGALYMHKHRNAVAGTLADLETSIQLFQRAFDATPGGHPKKAQQLHDLGGAYEHRYLQTTVAADLDKAIQRYRESLNVTPLDDPMRARRLHEIGLLYRRRHQRTEAKPDLDMAIQNFKAAIADSSSPPMARLQPGKDLFTLYAQAETWSLAYQVACTTVALIPLLTPRSLENFDKQYLLTTHNVASFASDASAVSLIAGESPYEAVRLLEIGRAIIIGSLNDIRADISDLQQRHPQLANEYIAARDLLDNTSTLSVERHVNQRYDADRKLEQLVQEIRELPGFDRFLLAPTEDELKATADRGPIVVVNISDYRCDAFIIEKSGLQTVPLPLLTNGDIRARATAARETKVMADAEVLEWLWDTIAEPVLDVLHFTTPPPGDCWPRIWWVPTGPLTRFPIHAAGYHLSDPPKTVLDRVISSYSPSVKTLVQSRQNSPQPRQACTSKKVVLVGIKETPGYQTLPFISEEIDQLQAFCNRQKFQLSKPDPYQEAVLSALNDCDIFHFAGHGLTDSLDPSKSCLLLCDGPLTVARLLETNIHSRQPLLAYLSACGTGQIDHDGLIDEGLHLITACQLVGFQHVIGTLWEVNDRFCAEIAAMIYDWTQTQGMSGDSISEGLHHASMSLRKQWISENTERAKRRHAMAAGSIKESQINIEERRTGQPEVRGLRDVVLCEDTPLYWVPYVHFGV